MFVLHAYKSRVLSEHLQVTYMEREREGGRGKEGGRGRGLGERR